MTVVIIMMCVGIYLMVNNQLSEKVPTIVISETNRDQHKIVISCIVSITNRKNIYTLTTTTDRITISKGTFNYITRVLDEGVKK